MAEQDRNPAAGGGPQKFQDRWPVDIHSYHRLHRESLEDREGFWRREAERLVWEREPESVVREDLVAGELAWFGGGALRPLASSLDRHLAARGDEPALLRLADGGVESLGFRELHERVERLAAALTAAGLKAGDRVALYLPPSFEGISLMLACARAGMPYLPLATTLSAGQVRDRITDARAALLVVATGTGLDPYGPQRDTLLAGLEDLPRVAIGPEAPSGCTAFADLLASGEGAAAPDVALEAAAPLFIIYADTIAGRPRGRVFAAGGFLVQAASGYDLIFQTAERCRVLSTRSLASIAGQSFGLWAPLMAGDALVLPPRPENLPAAVLRELAAQARPDLLLSTPRVLAQPLAELEAAPLPEGRRFCRVASSGGVLSPRMVSRLGAALTGDEASVLNLWVQQAAGSPLIADFPHADLNRPGALGLPLPGVEPLVLGESGQPCRSHESGQLVFASTVPGMVQRIWEQPQRLRETYFERLPGFFHTGDGARVDQEGFIWFMGRLDDVVKIAGQSLATSELEALLSAHPRVAEAAVVGVHGEQGDSISVFLVVEGGRSSEAGGQGLEEELDEYIRQRVGDFAVPEHVFEARELPRTRTGKVVRRLLRRIATGEATEDEDLSHVANPESVRDLIDRKGD
ncbi:MAG: AMP-binding protein [Candidatus Krumholzibacteriota bacterium]|nr:AMP-binding protein [Candidatus Krumholzibacteriota bacterium]